MITHTIALSLYFFIAAQVDQVTWLIWIAVAEQLKQSGQQ